MFTVCMNSTIIRLFASETDAPNCAESRTSVTGITSTQSLIGRQVAKYCLFSEERNEHPLNSSLMKCEGTCSLKMTAAALLWSCWSSVALTTRTGAGNRDARFFGSVRFLGFGSSVSKGVSKSSRNIFCRVARGCVGYIFKHGIHFQMQNQAPDIPHHHCPSSNHFFDTHQ